MNAHPDHVTFLPLTQSMRLRIEATIEQLVALLDEIDGEVDLEDDGSCEPWLGWNYTPEGDHPLIGFNPYEGDDREMEDEHDEDSGDREYDGDDEPDFDAEESSEGFADDAEGYSL